MTEWNCRCPNDEHTAQSVEAINARYAAFAYASEVRDALGVDDVNGGEDWGWT